MTPQTEIMLLLDRIARLHAARRRAVALTDAQCAALEYLAQGNRFSRSPSVIADYLATTRGTASQTLKALAEKGLISEEEAEGAPGRDATEGAVTAEPDTASEGIGAAAIQALFCMDRSPEAGTGAHDGTPARQGVKCAPINTT